MSLKCILKEMGEAIAVFGEERMQKEKDHSGTFQEKGLIQGKLKVRKTNRNKQVPQRHVHGETQNMGVAWWVLEPGRTEFKFHLSH